MRTCGLAVCPKSSCLYASTCSSDSVHRVELKVGHAVKKWSVTRSPVGLSVNKAHNLVVTCCWANKLQEYSTHGSVVREICLNSEGCRCDLSVAFCPTVQR